MNKLNLKIIFLALLLPCMAYAQGWEKTYDSGYNEKVMASDKTLDEGIIMAGIQKGNPSGIEYSFLYKMDAIGNLVWEYYDSTYSGAEVKVYDVVAISDGNYLLSSNSSLGGSSSLIPILQKISSNGTFLWSATFPSTDIDYILSIEETSEGNFIVTGYNDNNESVVIAKLNSTGIVLWQTEYSYNNKKTRPNRVLEANNGDILLAASRDTIPSYYSDLVVARFNPSGDLIWEQVYLNQERTVARGITELNTGEIVIAGSATLSELKPVLMKTDENGNLLWSKSYLLVPFNCVALSVYLQPTNDGGFALSGMFLEGFSPLKSDLYLLKLDSQGEEMWRRIHGRSNDEFSGGLHLTDDSGYYLIGYTYNIDDTYDAYLIRTDSLGYSITNQLNGNLYFDENENCTLETNEIGMNQWLVTATKGDIQYSDLTDDLGNFEFIIDTGTYQVTAHPITPYWGICNNNFDVSFTTFFDTISENIGANIIFDCPLMDVSIGTPFLRRCFENRYTIQYCNHGTIQADDVYVEIMFDTAMTITNSSIPIASQMDNIYTFELGEIPWGDCGNFTVDVLLGDTTNCNAIPLGATHCVEAHIYPDSICLPSGSWSGASVEVDANCEGDTISFFIQNVGTAATQPNLQYIVVEDDVILFDGNFTLNPMENNIIQVATNGATFRLEAEQEPNHPGMSMPSVTVEGCAVDITNTTLGFLNIFSQDDGDTFVDIDCRENIGAYDPNDKIGFPLGRGFENYIDRGQDIEYQIRFQNTGTDTAFNIVVVDTLSEFLDITTIRPGASSHPYQFDISTGGRLSFTFSNIMLPDSFVNEPASNGFVKFKVAQKPNLDLETQILNSVAIYFDFNAPIFTNQTLHTIGEDFFIVSIEDLLEESLAQVKVHPNPFSQIVNFEIEGLGIQNGTFKLYDAMGRLLRLQKFDNNIFTFQKKDLQAGMYFFTIEENGQLISNGKLIAQ